jgi:hypothetical protein
MEKKGKGRPRQAKNAIQFWQFARAARVMCAYDEARERGDKHSVAVKANLFTRLDILGSQLDPEGDRLLGYETSLDRAIDRVLNQLERHQRMRLGHPVLPAVNVNVTSS